MHSFRRTAELYDERFVTIIENESAVRVRQFCLDPSLLLRKALARGKAAVFFSATLTPLFTDLKNEKKNYPRDPFHWFYGKMGYAGYHQFASWAALRQGDFKLHYDYQGKVERYNIAEDISEKNNLAHAQPKLALTMLDDLTDWLRTDCNAVYLPKANPDFNPQGPLPYGPYIPFEKLKKSLFHDTPEDLEN